MISVFKRAAYVFAYYSHLMTEQERLANWHLGVTVKATGRDDVDAQDKAKFCCSWKYVHDGLSDDPAVLLMARDGSKAFALRTGQRIFHDHHDQIEFNCCPRCGGIARTPTARQCRYCRHDWHTAETRATDPR